MALSSAGAWILIRPLLLRPTLYMGVFQQSEHRAGEDVNKVADRTMVYSCGAEIAQRGSRTSMDIHSIMRHSVNNLIT